MSIDRDSSFIHNESLDHANLQSKPNVYSSWKYPWGLPYNMWKRAFSITYYGFSRQWGMERNVTYPQVIESCLKWHPPWHDSFFLTRCSGISVYFKVLTLAAVRCTRGSQPTRSCEPVKFICNLSNQRTSKNHNYTSMNLRRKYQHKINDCNLNSMRKLLLSFCMVPFKIP